MICNFWKSHISFTLQKQGANADFLELSEMEQNKYMFTLSTSKLIKNGLYSAMIYVI